MAKRKASPPPMTRAEADARRAEAAAAAAEQREIDRILAGLQEQAATLQPQNFGFNTDALALKSNRDIETKEIDLKGKKLVFKRRQADTVWARLGASVSGREPALSAQLVDAGERLTEIYAEMLGLAGAAERDPLQPAPTSPPNKTNLPIRMLVAGELWGDIMKAFGSGSPFPKMFEALCDDMMQTEANVSYSTVVGRKLTVKVWRSYSFVHAEDTERRARLFRTPGAKVRSNWRAVVSRATGVRDRNAQAAVVKLACVQLDTIMEGMGLFY